MPVYKPAGQNRPLSKYFAALLILGTTTGITAAEELATGPRANDAVRHGAALAEANCALCHAVGLEGDSTHPDAPPFWSLPARRPVEYCRNAADPGIP